MALTVLSVSALSACAELGYDGSDIPSVEVRSGELSLVGASKGDLSEYNTGVFGDVAGYKSLAFVGKWREDCPGTGVDIIDISRPSAPTKLSDTNDYPDTSMEDMEAIEIDGQDILVVGLQECADNTTSGVGRSGLELYDITDPSNPRYLTFFNTDTFVSGSGGVHELHLTTTPSGDVLALGAVPGLEASTSDSAGKDGTGDLLIWKISDPSTPTLMGEWGLLGEASLKLNTYLEVMQGGDPRTYGHSPRANADGTHVYLSYADAAVIIFDISDPRQPVYLGRTSYSSGEEDNAHSTAEAQDGNILIQADEDTSPFHYELASNAFSDKQLADEVAFEPPITDGVAQMMDGEVVHVGRGCPAGSITSTNSEDPYLADPSGKIALIERGGCRFDYKIAWVQQAGAKGAIIYNSASGGEKNLADTVGSNPVTLSDGTVVDIDTPARFVQRSTGLLLRDGTPPVTVSAAAVFDGWGYLRFFDIRDPANPKQLSNFATENTNNEALASEALARQGEEWWSVHNPEARGDTVYASWFYDGVRAVDVADLSSPREVASWTGEDAPEDAPAVDIWGVVPHDDLLLVSDRNYGLYILEHTS